MQANAFPYSTRRLMPRAGMLLASLAACAGAWGNSAAVCEPVYQALVQRHGQDYGACLSDVQAQPAACPKPAGFNGEPKANLNVVVALDASGSMSGQVKGGQKMQVAKDAVAQFVGALPDQVRAGLVVYGHKGSNTPGQKQLSCNAAELVYPVQTINRDAFRRAVDSFGPTGWTPIGGALKKAGEVLADQRADASTNIVYLVSDGIETCGGDPVAAARDLHQSNIKAVINVIGFDVDSQAQQQLRAVANSGGGKYFEARDAAGIRRALNEEQKSLAAYNAYFLCMTKSSNDMFLAYTRKQNEISACMTTKSRTEYSAIAADVKSWHDKNDPQRQCAAYVGRQNSDKVKRITDWKSGIAQSLQSRRQTTHDELAGELQEVLKGRERR